MATDLPDVMDSISVSSYMQEYVDWDVDIRQWVSCNTPAHTKPKAKEVEFIRQSGANLSELEFLMKAEQDPKVQKMLIRLLKQQCVSRLKIISKELRQ